MTRKAISIKESKEEYDIEKFDQNRESTISTPEITEESDKREDYVKSHIKLQTGEEIFYTGPLEGWMPLTPVVAEKIKATMALSKPKLPLKKWQKQEKLKFKTMKNFTKWCMQNRKKHKILTHLKDKSMHIKELAKLPVLEGDPNGNRRIINEMINQQILSCKGFLVCVPKKICKYL